MRDPSSTPGWTLDLGSINAITPSDGVEHSSDGLASGGHAPVSLARLDADGVGQSRALASLEQGFVLLGQAETIDEVKEIRDKAEALNVYAAQARLGHDVQVRCAELKLRAERKAGALLSELLPHGGGRRGKRSQRATVSELGITKSCSSRWQRLAAIPEEIFAEYMRQARVGGKITEAGLLRFAHQAEDRQRLVEDATRRLRSSITGSLRAIDRLLRSLPHEAATLLAWRERLEAQRGYRSLADVIEESGRPHDQIVTPIPGVMVGSPTVPREDWTGRPIEIRHVNERTAVVCPTDGVALPAQVRLPRVFVDPEVIQWQASESSPGWGSRPTAGLKRCRRCGRREDEGAVFGRRMVCTDCWAAQMREYRKRKAAAA